MVKKQGEFDGMPEQSELGKLALKFVDYDEKIASLQADQKKVALELIQGFRDAGKRSIKVDGKVVSMTTVSARTVVNCKDVEKKRNITKD